MVFRSDFTPLRFTPIFDLDHSAFSPVSPRFFSNKVIYIVRREWESLPDGSETGLEAPEGRSLYSTAGRRASRRSDPRAVRRDRARHGMPIPVILTANLHPAQATATMARRRTGQAARRMGYPTSLKRVIQLMCAVGTMPAIQLSPDMVRCASTTFLQSRPST